MRPTVLHVDTQALLHNYCVISQQAPQSEVIAMVKSNAYGCGLEYVVRALSNQVYAFGVACVAEAMAIRAWGIQDKCVIFQGVHQAHEWQLAAQHGFEVILHHPEQLRWLTETALSRPVKIWIKINTGMHRLGFPMQDLKRVEKTLRQCAWVHEEIGLMTHFACADEPNHPLNKEQIDKWLSISKSWNGPTSACNSAAIWSFPECHGTHIRPGITLYGVSPFADKTFKDLQLKPVMRYCSALMTLWDYPVGASIGYGASFTTTRPSKIGIVAVGYGDGYPRHMQHGSAVWINGQFSPIVGRISMDMMAVDLTDCTGVHLGDHVELWGENLPIEKIAEQAGTIPYEIMCQVCPRERLLELYFNR
jgi:alanine racemase